LAPHTRETSSTSVAAAMAVVDRYVVCSMSVSKSFAVVLGKYTQRARKVIPMLEKRMRSRMKTTTEIVPGVSDAGRGVDTRYGGMEGVIRARWGRQNPIRIWGKHADGNKPRLGAQPVPPR